MPKFDVMTTHMYSKDSAAEKIYENMKWEKEQGEWTNEKGKLFLRTSPDSEVKGVEIYDENKVQKNR